jgi:hypothetical protein
MPLEFKKPFIQKDEGLIRGTTLIPPIWGSITVTGYPVPAYFLFSAGRLRSYLRQFVTGAFQPAGILSAAPLKLLTPLLHSLCIHFSPNGLGFF